MFEQERFALGGDRRVDDRFEPGELLGDCRTPALPSLSRDTPSASVLPGKACSIAGTRPSGPCSARTSASASKTGTPAASNTAATVDLPMPIDPVSPTISGLVMREPFAQRGIVAARRSAAEEMGEGCGSLPDQHREAIDGRRARPAQEWRIDRIGHDVIGDRTRRRMTPIECQRRLSAHSSGEALMTRSQHPSRSSKAKSLGPAKWSSGATWWSPAGSSRRGMRAPCRGCGPPAPG